MRTERVAVSAVFFLDGAVLASWVTRIPAVSDRTGLPAARRRAGGAGPGVRGRERVAAPRRAGPRAEVVTLRWSLLGVAVLCLLGAVAGARVPAGPSLPEDAAPAAPQRSAERAG